MLAIGGWHDELELLKCPAACKISFGRALKASGDYVFPLAVSFFLPPSYMLFDISNDILDCISLVISI